MPRIARLQPVEILLVEDSEDDVVIIQETLADSKLVNVQQVARDGEEALAYLTKSGPFEAAGSPGLVLLDLNMPKMNGFEVLDAMKSDKRLRHIPVVMLTVSDREEDVAEAYIRGACTFVRKPVSLNRFKEVAGQLEVYWSSVAQVPRG